MLIILEYNYTNIILYNINTNLILIPVTNSYIYTFGYINLFNNLGYTL